MLNYPKRNIHKEDHCNPEQVKIIETYSNPIIIISLTMIQDGMH